MRVKDIFLTPITTATVLMQKNQNAKIKMKIPAIAPITLRISPSATELTPKMFPGNVDGARLPRLINPAAVYPAGPTETYIPGLVEGVGKALVIKR